MSDPLTGVNPRHFLDGGMGREEAASAYLATLLEQSRYFRSEFFRITGIQEFPNPRIEVEHDLRDVTISGDNVVVIVEVKIADGSKSNGQLRNYYDRFNAEQPKFTVHTVYLARTAEVGRSEADQVECEPNERAVALGWSDIATISKAVPDFDKTFATCGIEIILDVIKRRHSRSAREWSDTEFKWREIVRSVGANLKQQGLNWRIDPFGCELWVYGPITIVAKCKPTTAEPQLDNELDCELELRFRLAGAKSAAKSFERPFAKRWIERLKKTKKWNSYELDPRDNWFIKVTHLIATQQRAIEHIQLEVQQLLTLIYGELEREQAIGL